MFTLSDLAYIQANLHDPPLLNDTYDLTKAWYMRRHVVNLRLVMAGKYVVQQDPEENPIVSGDATTIEGFVTKLSDAERAVYKKAFDDALAARRANSVTTAPSPPPTPPPA